MGVVVVMAVITALRAEMLLLLPGDCLAQPETVEVVEVLE